MLMKTESMRQISLAALGVAFFLLIAGEAAAGGNVAAGESKAAVCLTCHGPAGNAPISPDYPRLGGQHADYLLHALQDYKKGARKNPIMSGQVEQLSKQDMVDLAAYFGAQAGTLVVKY
jgi:cytochrome c553